METSHQNFLNMKHLSLRVQEQESSSTQSTGQSHQEVAAVGEGNPRGKCISAQSGNEETYGKQVEGHLKPVFSLGTADFMVLPSQVNYGQPVAHVPYPYADPHFGGLLAAYGPQAIIHPQMVGIAPARVPLPLKFAENEPIFVNAKQYRGILRRRHSRAKLEAQNKIIKNRKPYLHESRHLHAVKRARGSGGRFLNTKKLQQSKSTSITASHDTLDSSRVHRGGNYSESEIGYAGTSTTSCSDITSVSNGDFFQQSDFSFSGYPLSHMQGDGGGLTCNGSHLRVPVMR